MLVLIVGGFAWTIQKKRRGIDDENNDPGVEVMFELIND